MTVRLSLPATAALTAVIMAQSPLPPTVQVPPASPHAAAGVNYADVTAAAGLATFRHVSGSPEKSYLLETTGSGVAMADLDRAGLRPVVAVERAQQRALAGA